MAKVGSFEKFYNWMETTILDKLVAQDNPGPVFKWLFKMPILQYKLGMGWMVGNYILLLTTTGRKSGKLRYTPLEYIYDKENDRYRISAGWGGNTDWYRNIKANQCVHVQVGRRSFDAVAEIASDKEVAEFMMYVSSRHPRMDKVWNRWSDTPVDETLESYIHAAKFFPSVWLKPNMESNVSRRSSQNQKSGDF